MDTCLNTASAVEVEIVGSEIKMIAPTGYQWKLVKIETPPLTVTELPFWKTLNLVKGLH